MDIHKIESANPYSINRSPNSFLDFILQSGIYLSDVATHERMVHNPDLNTLEAVLT